MRTLAVLIALALLTPVAAAPKKDDKPAGFMSKCRAHSDCPKTMVCTISKGKQIGSCTIPLAPIKKR